MALQNVVVVGASLAGLRAVEALRRRGYAGRLVVLGAEPHLPYDRPPLSKEVLAGKWEPERTQLRKPESYDELEAEWRLGARAVALDPAARKVTLESGESVPYDGLVIATGATARQLPGAAPLDGIHTLRSLDDCLAIRGALDAGARVAVVGAGFIGAEVAATCRARGLQVTLLEALPVPLEPSLGAEMGGRLAGIHADHGVDLRCGVRVAALEGGGRVERLRLDDGSHIEADAVVVGIGVAPETRWLASSGLPLDDGVLCDASCAAGAPGVVAAGDVARWHHVGLGETLRVEHWTNATEQADAAVERLLDGEAAARPFAPVPYFWSDQFGIKIQFAGRAGLGDEMRIVDGDPEQRRFVALYGRKGRLVGVLGFDRPRLVMRYRRMIREGVPFEQAVAPVGGPT